MNKKGITRIIEVLISVTIIAVALLILSRPQITYNEPLYINKMNKILEEVAKTPQLRQEVFDSSHPQLDTFINQRMNEIGLNAVYIICPYSTSCSLPSQNIQTDLYVSDWVYIVDESVNLSSPTILILGGYIDEP